MKGRVVHCKKAPYDIYVGRPSPWGNPFSHKPGTLARFRVATRDEAVSSFEHWARNSEDPEALWIREHVHELQGKTLGCWCAPLPCHADVLLTLAQEAARQP